MSVFHREGQKESVGRRGENMNPEVKIRFKPNLSHEISLGNPDCTVALIF